MIIPQHIMARLLPYYVLETIQFCGCGRPCCLLTIHGGDYFFVTFGIGTGGVMTHWLGKN